MSRWTDYVLLCPCGARFGAILHDGIDASTATQRARILDGTFQQLTCPGCAATRTALTELAYLDLSARQFVMVAPPWRMADHARYSALTESAFDRHLRRAAPPMVQALVDEFRVRLVFGLDALAERLRAWDAGLDDQLIEAVKATVLGGEPARIGAAPCVRLVAVDKAAWQLTFDIDGTEQVEVDLDLYLRAQADRALLGSQLPAIFAAPFGGFDAWLVDLLAPAWARRPHFETIGTRQAESSG